MSYTNEQKIADETVRNLSPVSRVVTQWTLKDRKDGIQITALQELETRATLARIASGELNEAALAQSLLEHAQVLRLPNVRPIDQKLWKFGLEVYLQIAPLTAIFTEDSVYGKDRRYIHECLSNDIQPEWGKLRARFTHSWEGDVIGHYWEDFLEKVADDFYPNNCP